MSKVRVTLNYVDVAHLLTDIKKADTFEEVVVRTNRLESILDAAAQDKTAEFINEDGKTMKKILGLALLICFITAPAFAGGKTCENSNFWNAVANECSPHTVDTDTWRPERDNPAGVGADILIHETEHVDLVGEYKYDFENEEHSAFAVFKTKKSLVEIIKGFFNKD
jgi:hypothetical protein